MCCAFCLLTTLSLFLSSERMAPARYHRCLGDTTGNQLLQFLWVEFWVRVCVCGSRTMGKSLHYVWIPALWVMSKRLRLLSLAGATQLKMRHCVRLCYEVLSAREPLWTEWIDSDLTPDICRHLTWRKQSTAVIARGEQVDIDVLSSSLLLYVKRKCAWVILRKHKTRYKNDARRPPGARHGRGLLKRSSCSLFQITVW